jgi:hypothetical protein
LVKGQGFGPALFLLWHEAPPCAANRGPPHLLPARVVSHASLHFEAGPKLKGPAKDFQVGSQVRVFGNGRLLYTDKYDRVLSKNESGGGVLSLGSALSPGEYLLQVVVTDENAGTQETAGGAVGGFRSRGRA